MSALAWVAMSSNKRTCIQCRHAEWELTERGRISRKYCGYCKRPISIPANAFPTPFYTNDLMARIGTHNTYGATISARYPHSDCPCFEPIEKDAKP